MNITKITQYDNDNGFAIQETLERAQREGYALPSSEQISERLLNSEIWKTEKEMYPCRTGTLAIFEEVGKPFGKTVEFDGLTAQIPKKFQDKTNMVILCNHPNFKFRNGVIMLGKEAKIQPMPKEDGWYDVDSIFEYPTGEKKNYADNRRCLWRNNSAWVGLVVRRYDYFCFGDDRRSVVCNGDSTHRFGVFGIRGKMPKHKHEWETVCKTCGEKKKRK